MADIYKIGYQKQARDGYKAKREVNEKKLGDTKAFHERVKTVEGKVTPSGPAKDSRQPERVVEPIPANYVFPVASVRSEKAATVDVRGKIRDNATMKSATRSGGGKGRKGR